MTDFNADNFVKELKIAGYFKQSEETFRGNVFRYNKLYGGFQELNNKQFINILNHIIKNVNLTYEYWYYIKNNLNVFPSKEYKQYQTYIGLSKKNSFDSIEREFLRRFYKDNRLRKRETEITQNVSLSNDIQVLINNDIFTDGNDLYKYDLDNKTFILVTENNIGSLIDCNNPKIATKILETGLNNKYLLINIHFTVDSFKEAKNRDVNLKANEDGYKYIIDLIENITVKYEDTFGLIF